MKGTDFLDLLEAAIHDQLKSAREFAQSDEYAYGDVHDWLQQFAVGTGLDICAGNFPTLSASGTHVAISVDRGIHLGNVINGICADATNLSKIDTNSMDYVVTNYLEGIEMTLKALHEWYRVLKPGGTLAMIVSNAEATRYQVEKGPLANRRRLAIFTPLTLVRYLERAGFVQIQLENKDHQIRVSAKKGKT